MNGLEQKILELDNDLRVIVTSGIGTFDERCTRAKEKLTGAIADAKAAHDGMTQLYACMAEVTLDRALGTEDEKALLGNLSQLLHPQAQFILAPEKGKSAEGKMQLDADTYGLYYALNDHYSKQWERHHYRLARNGDAGNPLITNLFKCCYENDDGKPLYTLSNSGYVQHTLAGTKGEKNSFAAALFAAFERHGTTIFPDVKMAYLGGDGASYHEIVLPLSRQFSEGAFLSYAPQIDDKHLTFATADRMGEAGKLDYVVSSNVLNAFDHDIRHEQRDELFAACAKILKKGGKAIHLMEKSSEQRHFNTNLSPTLHDAVGQKLVYSFHREDGPMDKHMKRDEKATLEAKAEIEALIARMDLTNPDRLRYKEETLDKNIAFHERELEQTRRCILDDKPDYFRTSMLVMHQESKPYLNHTRVASLRQQMNDYQQFEPGYEQPVYCEKPGQSLGRGA